MHFFPIEFQSIEADGFGYSYRARSTALRYYQSKNERIDVVLDFDEMMKIYRDYYYLRI